MISTLINLLQEGANATEQITMLLGEIGAYIATVLAFFGVKRRRQKKNGGTTYDYLVRIEKKVDKLDTRVGKIENRLSVVETKIDLYHGKKKGGK